MDTAVKPEKVTLSRDLSEFLVELSIAVQKYAMYPGGHPSLAASTGALTRRAERLLDHRPNLVFGVARRQLIIDGVATDPDHPVLRRLAEGLHRHHLGAVSLTRGLEPDELGLALRALASEAERDGALGLAPTGEIPEWPHVHFHPLTFDHLELADSEKGADGKADVRAAELWVGLARAAMAGSRSAAPDEPVPTEPSVVAQAIDERHGAEAYDQVIVGYLLQISNELKDAPASEAVALRQRTAQLVASLRPETLRRLVAMGGDAAQRRDFVMNATSGMAVESVIEIVKAAADTSGQAISDGLLRMLNKLGQHAERGGEQARPAAGRALREQVDRLLTGWQLEDPNPEQYGKVLQRLASSASTKKSSSSVRRAGEQDPLRIVQMSLEVGAFGPLVDRAVDQLIASGRFRPILRLLASMPSGCVAAAEQLLARLASPAAMEALVGHEPLDVEALDRLLPLLSLDAYEVLLNTLVTSKDRSVRRMLLDRLGQTTLDAAPLIAARLHDDRWYVVRNMLVLLQRLRRFTPGFSALQWAEHSDVRVRVEAIQLALLIRAERDVALRRALAETDIRMLRLGLTAVQQDCPRALTPLVISQAVDAKAADDVRVLATRTLGRTRDLRARDALLQLVDGGRTLLGRPKLAPATTVSIAAIRALADGWSHDPAAAPIIQLAAASADPELRQAAQGEGR
jgi:hypothetical protein